MIEFLIIPEHAAMKKASMTSSPWLFLIQLLNELFKSAIQ